VSHAFDAATPESAAPARPARAPGLLGACEAVLAGLNRVIMALGGLALVGACLVLTYSVVVRYALHLPTDWQDETAVFLIVGATFFSAAAVQAKRGHVAIGVLTGLLPPRADRVRLVVVDLLTFLFCAFFAWKSWMLFHEAWVDDQTSSSTWGPPLWIPYSLMAVGMTLLSVQVALQTLVGAIGGRRAAGHLDPKVGLGADLAQAPR
jgi:TRAP-type C4-dicarboxylate transport system permease small subunit